MEMAIIVRSTILLLAVVAGSFADKAPISGSESLSHVSDYFDYYYPPDDAAIGSGTPAVAPATTGRYKYPSYAAAPGSGYGPPDPYQQPAADYGVPEFGNGYGGSAHGHGHGQHGHSHQEQQVQQQQQQQQWQPAAGGGGKKYVPGSNPVVFPSSGYDYPDYGNGRPWNSNSYQPPQPVHPNAGQSGHQYQQLTYDYSQQNYGAIPPDVTGPFCGRFKCYGDEFCDVIDSSLMCVPNFCRDYAPSCPPGCGLSFKYGNRCPVCDRQCVKNQHGKQKPHPCENVICAHPSQICIDDHGKARCQIIPLNICESIKCPLFQKCIVEDKTPVCRSWFWKP